jgi:hypothetical protein
VKFQKLFVLFILLFILLNISALPWGKDGHKLINRLAVNQLPEEMAAYKSWENYLIDNAVEADDRRKFDSTEIPKHYIDIDYYDEYKNGIIIKDKNELITKYSDSTVIQMGILPWATLESYNNLTKAFAENNRDKALIFAADLAHYISDGHQPMHIILNYDGQLSDQKGIHGRYESRMVSKYLTDLENLTKNYDTKYVQEKPDYIFNYLMQSFSVRSVLFEADLEAFETAGSRENDEYYRLLWFKTKYITSIQISRSANAVASLIYSAWVDAGKPELNLLN